MPQRMQDCGLPLCSPTNGCKHTFAGTSRAMPALAALIGLTMSVKPSRRTSSSQGTASDCGRRGVCREVHEHISVPKSFVYVYDMPSQFNSDILDLPTIWHPEQYDIDQVSHLLLIILDGLSQSTSTCRCRKAIHRFMIPEYICQASC